MRRAGAGRFRGSGRYAPRAPEPASFKERPKGDISALR